MRRKTIEIIYLINYRDNPIGMQGNIALRYGQLIAKLWGNVRGPLAPFELRVSCSIQLILVRKCLCYLGFSC
jgi:hypothetical protein